MTRILALQKLKITLTLAKDVTTILSMCSAIPRQTSCHCVLNN